MINESGFDGVCYDDKAVFWHSGSLLLSAIADCPNLKMRTFRDWGVPLTEHMGLKREKSCANWPLCKSRAVVIESKEKEQEQE